MVKRTELNGQMLNLGGAGHGQSVRVAVAKLGQVEVALAHRGIGEKVYYLTVSVRSVKYANKLKCCELLLTGNARMTSVEKIRQAVSVAAGACAESCCEDFGDQALDPHEVAKDAAEVWAALLYQPALRGLGA
jgi:hypothetical protein